MKIRFLSALVLISLTLTACNFSLAEDITPPPGYQSPVPEPTLGALFPSQPPSPARGESIYFTKCAPCHGEDGLGNGPESGQLPVPVSAIGLRDISKQSNPAEWYTIITQGRMDRYMPGFSSLDDRQRWDVLAYTYGLSTTSDELKQGATLYTSQCATCHGMDGKAIPQADFTNQQFMSQMTGTGLYRTIAEGTDRMPSFSAKLSDADIWALVDTLRLFTFDMTPLVQPTVTQAPASPAPLPTNTEIPGTPGETTPTPEAISPDVTATPAVAVGNVSGSVVSPAGGTLPEGTTVTLHGFDHGQEAAPTEVITLDGTINADGSYLFENVEMPAGRIFLAEVTVSGLSNQSEFVTVEEGMSQVTLPTVTIYEATDDFSGLVVNQLHIIMDMSQADSLIVYEIYIVTNPSDKAIRVVTDGTSLPFVRTPEGATPMGIQLTQDSAQLMGTPDGFAIPPGEQTYGFVTLFMLPYSKKLDFSQSFVLSSSAVTVFVPQGVKIRAGDLTKGSPQSFGEQVYDVYTRTALGVNETLSLSISGMPKAGGTFTPTISTQTWVVIGFAAIGLVLLGISAWLFLRDRKKESQEDDEEDEPEKDPQAVMDAILALDDQFKAGGISKEAYEKRRLELKERLREQL